MAIARHGLTHRISFESGCSMLKMALLDRLMNIEFASILQDLTHAVAQQGTDAGKYTEARYI